MACSSSSGSFIRSSLKLWFALKPSRNDFDRAINIAVHKGQHASALHHGERLIGKRRAVLVWPFAIASCCESLTQSASVLLQSPGDRGRVERGILRKRGEQRSTTTFTGANPPGGVACYSLNHLLRASTRRRQPVEILGHLGFQPRQRGHGQLLLAFGEVMIEGAFRCLGSGKYRGDTGAVITLRLEKMDSGADQSVTSRRRDLRQRS